MGAGNQPAYWYAKILIADQLCVVDRQNSTINLAMERQGNHSKNLAG